MSASGPTVPNPVSEVLRRGPKGWWRPLAVIVRKGGFEFMDPSATNDRTIREVLGGPWRTLHRSSLGGAPSEYLEIVAPESPSDAAPVQHVDFGAGLRQCRGPLVLMRRTQGGFRTVLTQDALSNVRLEEREGVSGRVLSVGSVPLQLHAELVERSLRRARRVGAAVLLAAGWWVWRATHFEHPEGFVGTWAAHQYQPGGWERTDTIQIFPGGLAVRRGRSVWHGRPTSVGTDLGVDLDDLDMSGVYAWGVKHPAFRATELCLRWRGKAPPMGCAPVRVGGDTLTWGAVPFRRTSR